MSSIRSEIGNEEVAAFFPPVEEEETCRGNKANEGLGVCEESSMYCKASIILPHIRSTGLCWKVSSRSPWVSRLRRRNVQLEAFQQRISVHNRRGFQHCPWLFPDPVRCLIYCRYIWNFRGSHERKWELSCTSTAFSSVGLESFILLAN